MSIVDTWDWDKIDTSVYDEPIKMTADMKVRNAICGFVEIYNTFPNRIIMGYRLLYELRNIFFSSYTPLKTFEELIREQERGVTHEFEGIPIKVDNDNPDTLEVGLMIKWTEEKY
jgi:hypothetical protein